MKKKEAYVIGIIGILIPPLLVGIPFGDKPIEIVNLLLFTIGIIILSFIGYIRKNDRLLLIVSIIYLVIVMLLTLFIETHYKDYNVLYIGFAPGIVLSMYNLTSKYKRKDKVLFIISIIGLLLSIASFILGFING